MFLKQNKKIKLRRNSTTQKRSAIFIWKKRFLRGSNRLHHFTLKARYSENKENALFVYNGFYPMVA